MASFPVPRCYQDTARRRFTSAPALSKGAETQPLDYSVRAAPFMPADMIPLSAKLRYIRARS
jgi:hypothetical protein